jgi:carboxypeptidase D
LNSSLAVPLRGSAIGNGWIDARRQYPSYLDYAVKHGLVESGTAVRLRAFDESIRANPSVFQQYERGKEATDQCVALLDEMEGEPIHVETCEGLMQLIVNEPGGAECVFIQYIHCPLPTGFAAKRQANVSTFTMSV